MDKTKKEAKEAVEKYVSEIEPINGTKDKVVEIFKSMAPRISTGFLSMDIALNGGLTNELYILGAETSTGKSAIMMTIAQNIALQGIDVLYFSLEMSAEEFVARGTSTVSFAEQQKDRLKKSYSAGDLLYWVYDHMAKLFTRLPYNTYADYLDEYFRRYGEHLYIVESTINGWSAKDVANTAAIFKQKHGNKPVVVFVDYLQILKADSGDWSQADRKTKTDVAVVTLKTLASRFGIPVFTASSVGRAAYNGRITSASLKESGDIEYTGGILIGWNWKGVTDTTDRDEADIEKKACLDRGYRKMEFEVLKFRNAQRDQCVKLLYYPKYSYFIDAYDWHPAGSDNPFDCWDEDVSDKQKQTPRKIF